ncbi:B-cell receptor-associated protein 29 [Armadillidium nasatum]|uniref:Endoplasmic reticulum transmembrane protein n=1 Tax=Armadillidium nasatum TaxID=96803 RepID=A0A5N5SIM5_9CRUS|nr:B-cell receptor-associated protein 29 [Armadillidium nasatum]
MAFIFQIKLLEEYWKYESHLFQTVPRSVGVIVYGLAACSQSDFVINIKDAIREMRKYSNELDENKHADHGHHLDVEMQSHMRLFRSQRNFYISGFSLFLWVVLQRLTSLISRLAVAMAEKEAALRQAKSASDAASQMLASDKKKEKVDDSATIELKELKEVNRKLQKENEAALKQAKSVSDEYDRLLKEHTALQEKFSKLSNEEGSKKSD